MTPRTPTRIDPTNPANIDPDECTVEGIEAALEGRKLLDTELLQKVDPVCHRTEEKNIKRRKAGVELKDAQLNEGDRVTVHAVFDDAPDGKQPPHWHITRVDRADHPQVDFDKCIQTGVALVRVQARIHVSTEGTHHLVDVDVTDRSKSDEGPEQSVVDRRQQQYVDDSGDHPDDMAVITPDAEDPPANWPPEDRAWLNDLIDNHGPLEMPVYHLDAGDVDDLGDLGQ